MTLCLKDCLGVLAQVAGGKDESVTQPLWTPKNELLFISDRTGWWNIYRDVDGKVTSCALMLQPLLGNDGERRQSPCFSLHKR